MKFIDTIKRILKHEVENESLVPEEFSRKLNRALVLEMHKFVMQYPHSYFVDLAQKDIKFRAINSIYKNNRSRRRR